MVWEAAGGGESTSRNTCSKKGKKRPKCAQSAPKVTKVRENDAFLRGGG